MDPDKKLRGLAKQYVVYDVNKRRDYIKTHMLAGQNSRVKYRRSGPFSRKLKLALYVLLAKWRRTLALNIVPLENRV
jgi:hypothetical protein